MYNISTNKERHKTCLQASDREVNVFLPEMKSGAFCSGLGLYYCGITLTSYMLRATKGLQLCHSFDLMASLAMS